MVINANYLRSSFCRPTNERLLHLFHEYNSIGYLWNYNHGKEYDTNSSFHVK